MSTRSAFIRTQTRVEWVEREVSLVLTSNAGREFIDVEMKATGFPVFHPDFLGHL